MTPHDNLPWDAAVAAVLRAAVEGSNTEGLVDLIARIAASPPELPFWKEHFARLERKGFHLTPVHYYSPIPDVGALPEETWHQVSELPGLRMNDEEQLRLIRKHLSDLWRGD